MQMDGHAGCDVDAKRKGMTAMATTSINVRVSEARLRQLDALAEVTGCDRDYHVDEALRCYLDEDLLQLAKIEEGIRQADAGEFYTTDEVAAGVREIIAARRHDALL